jgi:hypothetical protein
LHLNHKATNVLLQISVVGFGFGMNVNSALAAGKMVFVYNWFYFEYFNFRNFYWQWFEQIQKLLT